MSLNQNFFRSSEWLLNQVSSTAHDLLLRAPLLVWTLLCVGALIPSSKVDTHRLLMLQLAGRGKIMDASSRMEAQDLRRLFESLYVFSYSPSARLHIAGYITGFHFYTVVPLSLCSMYSMEVFKYVVSLFAERKDRMQVTAFDLQFKWYVWIGGVVFLWGWIHQRRCHAILGSLSKDGGKVGDYALPEGDWFEHVSCPHYLAEIVIYVGLVIASGFSDITIWFIFGFVAANLTLAAGETHRKFENYPPNRRAIIPFVY